jgi:hypothetical protein
MADIAYPGELATAMQVHALAEQYRRASEVLLPLGRPGKPLTRAPFRLTAIHAVELYLSAFLLQRGLTPKRIRALQHNLGARAERAVSEGLQLRKRTLDHLSTLSANREYLVTRYGPELASTTSQLNRLTATLEEVAKKVSAALPPNKSLAVGGGAAR